MASGDKADTRQGPNRPSGTKAKQLSQDEQSERFIKAARSLTSDESGGKFRGAMESILPEKSRR